MRLRGDMKGATMEEGDPLGEGEVTPGHRRRKANVVARARLRGEAALRRHSGNFRNPRGWVCADSLTGDLGLSSPGSGRGMTSPGQALIGRRGQQVGAAWPGRPQPGRRGLGRTDPQVPPRRGSSKRTVRPRQRPHAREHIVGLGVLQGQPLQTSICEFCFRC